MNREQAITFLKTKPAKYGHMIGFTDLREVHNEWIKDMLLGKDDITKQASRLLLAFCFTMHVIRCIIKQKGDKHNGKLEMDNI